MTESDRAGLRSTSWPSRVRAILALAFIGLPSIAMAEDAVKLSPEQATSLGVRVVHPVASPTDKTLPYPAQIVIPTPQLWVVSSPVAGMVTGLSVARGDRVSAGQPLVVMESPSFVSQQREYMQAVAQTFWPPSNSTGTPSFSRRMLSRNEFLRPARPKPGWPAFW
jgi:membrane fusion protein, heavy metal efflux system